jgi:DNA-binding beta-propeller fold protein YncE
MLPLPLLKRLPRSWTGSLASPRWFQLVCALCCLPIAAGLEVSAVAKDGAAPAADSSDPQYPIAVATDGDALYVVDLDLPGVWKVNGSDRELFVQGTKLLRTPLNRPRCIAVHPQGGILVGDSATREVYYIPAANAAPEPLSSGRIGIAMAIAISPDGQTMYVGDAEKRNVVRLPIGGGEPEAVADVNARGLAFDHEGTLWAVTPADSAIYRIDVSSNSSTAVVTGRPFQYPNGLVWVGEYGLITDGYRRTLWKFTADGQTEPWFEGPPLVGPVGIASDEKVVWVADPKERQVFEFNLEDKEHRTRLE